MKELIATFAVYLSNDRQRAPSTRQRYLAVMDEFLTFLDGEFNGAVALAAVEKAHLAQFLRQGTKSAGIPSASVWNLRLSALRAFYDYLFEEEVVSVNPAKRILWQETEAPEPIPLSWEEYLALLEAAETSSAHYRSRNVAIVQVFFHSMLRVSELTSLNLSTVDFERYLFRNVRIKGGKRVSVLFNDLTAGALSDYLADREHFCPIAGEDAVFLSDRGKRLSVRAVQELMATLATRAGITRRIHPHLLRHGGATELAELGIDIEKVQRQLNHESPLTTQHYVHRRALAARRRALEELGKEATKRLRDYRNRGNQPPKKGRKNSA